MEPWRFLKPQMWDDLFTPQAAWIQDTGLVGFIKLKLKAMDVELVRKATQCYDAESKTIDIPEYARIELSDKVVGQALCLPFGAELEEIPTEYNSQLHGPEIQKYFSERGHSQASGWKLCEVKEHVMRVYLEFLVKRIGLRLNNQRVSGATAYPACATRSTKKVFNWAQFVALKMHKELKEGKPVTTAHYLSMVLQHHFDLPTVDLQPTMRFVATAEQSGKRKKLSWEPDENQDEELIETLRQPLLSDDHHHQLLGVEFPVRPHSVSINTNANTNTNNANFAIGEASSSSSGRGACSMQQKQVLSSVEGILKQMKQAVVQHKEALISLLWQAQQTVAQLEIPERSLDYEQLSARYTQLQHDYRSVCHQRDILEQQVSDLQEQFKASDELHSQRLEEANERLANVTRKLTDARQAAGFAARANCKHSVDLLHDQDGIMEYGFGRLDQHEINVSRLLMCSEIDSHGRGSGNACAEAVSNWLFATSSGAKNDMQRI